MMMSKPRPEESEDSNPVNALEQRLAMLGNTNGAMNDPPPPFEAVGENKTMAPPADGAPKTAAKNPLLARIMAAQERAKQAQKPPPMEQKMPPPSFDVFEDLSAPAPAFDSAALPPPTADAPPAFDDSFMPPPPAPTDIFDAPAPPTPSAPAFEDLLDMGLGQQQQQQQQPDSLHGMEFMAPPAPPTMDAPPAPPAEDHMDFSGLEGLSEEEKAALIEEQRQIMEQIEKRKTQDAASEAVARAEAFEQRSNVAAVAAIGGNRNTTLVSSPISSMAALSQEEAAQLEADRKLAESLQNEEYKQASADREARTQRQTQQAQAQQQKSSGWMEWLGLSAGEPTTRPIRPASSSPRGVGTEEITFSNSYEESRGSGARMAQQKPMFSCVADGISSAVNSLASTTLLEDAEGNVHGVDASSLLAVTQASRNNDYDRK